MIQEHRSDMSHDGRRKVVLVIHGTSPRDDRASDHLARLGYELVWKSPFQGDSLGRLSDDVAGTIVYGGKYCISEIPDLPFMQEEIAWLKECMENDVPTLGICQGAQMIAHILGADVGPHPEGWQEFGYYPVWPTHDGHEFLPREMHMVQCHFHQFDLPGDARLLASSKMFRNQAFSWGDYVYGVQFHPEVTRAGFRRWQDASWSQPAYGSPGVQTRAEQNRLGLEHDAVTDNWFRSFLDRMFGEPHEARANPAT